MKKLSVLTFILAILSAPLVSATDDGLMCYPSTAEWPFKFIEVTPHQYKRDYKVEHCTRPKEMVDTIVLHHSATGPDRSPDYLNDMHLNEGYHTIGYSYVVNSSYPGSSGSKVTVTEGRPLGLVGSHAGGEVYLPMSKLQKRLWDQGQVRCSVKGKPTSTSRYIQNGKILGNVTTIGVVVVGNYSPASLSNLNGYVISREPTATTLKSLAKLSCQIQKKHPNVKNISWHGNYRKTLCPGNVAKHIGDIKKYAKEMGCTF